MATTPKKRVRAPWIWYRAFGRNGAVTWGGAKVEIDLGVTDRNVQPNVGSEAIAALSGGALRIQSAAAFGKFRNESPEASEQRGRRTVTTGWARQFVTSTRLRTTPLSSSWAPLRSCVWHF